MPSTNEEKIKLLQKINVYTDPISNYVITYHLRSTDLYNEFSTTFGPLNLNIDNILQLKDVSGIKNKIFIFENPSILNYLKEIPLDASVIITSGVPNLAFYKLLEVVSKKNILYYNGDFDPEGLLIADKLNRKYSNLILFGYSEENYFKCKPKEIISDKSLHKLDLVKSNELVAVKKCILEKKKAGYQENNLEMIRQFLFDVL